jgi:hypothetical protein
MSLELSSLDSKVLATRLRELAGDRRNVDVDFILHLDEFDRRRAYLEAGYGSLWSYCTEALHLCEGSAGRRIQAMKVLRRFPSLEGALRDGRLSLSSIALLGQVATPDNVEDLLARAAYKSRADVDHLVASIQPRTAPKDGIRKLPERERASPALAQLPASLPEPTSDAVAANTALELAVARDIPAPAAAAGDPTPTPADPPLALAAPPARPSRPELRPVSGTEWSLRVTLDDACKADLETLRDLLSHKIPDGDLAAVLHEAIRCAIDKHGKRRGAVAPSRTRSPRAKAVPPHESAESAETATPRRSMPLPSSTVLPSFEATDPATMDSQAPDLFTPEPRSRPTAAVRREVYARDGGSCAWIGEDGRRCGSTWQLEHDHVQSAALGGGAGVDETRLLCRPHNLLHAEQVFGREFMERFRRNPGANEPWTTMM